jgi:hypothetical protein
MNNYDRYSYFKPSQPNEVSQHPNYGDTLSGNFVEGSGYTIQEASTGSSSHGSVGSRQEPIIPEGRRNWLEQVAPTILNGSLGVGEILAKGYSSDEIYYMLGQVATESEPRLPADNIIAEHQINNKQ